MKSFSENSVSVPYRLPDKKDKTRLVISLTPRKKDIAPIRERLKQKEKV